MRGKRRTDFLLEVAEVARILATLPTAKELAAKHGYNLRWTQKCLREAYLTARQCVLRRLQHRADS